MPASAGHWGRGSSCCSCSSSSNPCHSPCRELGQQPSAGVRDEASIGSLLGAPGGAAPPPPLTVSALARPQAQLVQQGPAGVVGVPGSLPELWEEGSEAGHCNVGRGGHCSVAAASASALQPWLVAQRQAHSGKVVEAEAQQGLLWEAAEGIHCSDPLGGSQGQASAALPWAPRAAAEEQGEEGALQQAGLALQAQQQGQLGAIQVASAGGGGVGPEGAQQGQGEVGGQAGLQRVAGRGREGQQEGGVALASQQGKVGSHPGCCAAKAGLVQQVGGAIGRAAQVGCSGAQVLIVLLNGLALLLLLLLLFRAGWQGLLLQH